jgi:hypothetical protein|nr:MAG TPA: tail assembly chaperone protein [Caudoviricetes sp.]
MTYYAKLANGRLKYAPVNLETETGVIFNYGLEVNAHQLLADGYKPVELLADRSGYSDCDGTFSFEFEEREDKIVEVAVFHRYSDEAKAQQVRERRNLLLKQTDILVAVPDYPLREGDKEKLIAYRQYLRDLPSEAEFPWVYVKTFEEWI